jgi:hypothetical protein
MRIFDLFSSNGKDISLHEYLKYIDLYHHGNEKERCIITYRLIDISNSNRVSFSDFENYLNIIITAIKKVHPNVEDNLITNKEMRALFDKISNNKEFFTYKDFEDIYFNKPFLLSWIDYFKNNDNDLLKFLNTNVKVLLIYLNRFTVNISTILKDFKNNCEDNNFFKLLINEIETFVGVINQKKIDLYKNNSTLKIKNIFKINKSRNKKRKKIRTQSLSRDDLVLDSPMNKISFNRYYNLNLENSTTADNSYENVKDHFNQIREKLQEEKPIIQANIDQIAKSEDCEIKIDKLSIGESVDHKEEELDELPQDIKFKNNEFNTYNDGGANKLNKTIEIKNLEYIENNANNSKLLTTQPDNVENVDISDTSIKLFTDKFDGLNKELHFITKWIFNAYNWIEEKVVKKELLKCRAYCKMENKVNKPEVSHKCDRKDKDKESKSHHHLKSKIKVNTIMKTTGTNFSILLNMLMGIQTSVLATNNIALNKDSDICHYLYFSEHSLFSTTFDHSDVKGTFKIISYADVVFNNIRLFYNINKEDYLQSISTQDFVTELMISGSTIIEELFSTSKSGSMFYHTRDGKYILKTMSNNEFECLKKLLPKYFKYVFEHRDTLLPKFYGCYKLKRKVRGYNEGYMFIMMENVFRTSKQLDVKFDLKGSTIGRDVLSKLTEEERQQGRFDFTLKDLDFLSLKQGVNVGASKRDALLHQIYLDGKFLRDNKLIDYSFLVGVYKMNNLENKVISKSVDNPLNHKENKTNINEADKINRNGLLDYKIDPLELDYNDTAENQETKIEYKHPFIDVR